MCQRARRELTVLDSEAGSGEAARDQMREVWSGLEEEIRKGTLDLGAPAVLRGYVKTHWRAPAPELPAFGGE